MPKKSPQQLVAEEATKRWANVAIKPGKFIEKGTKISVRMTDTGYARQETPCAGYIFEDREGNDTFIPQYLLPRVRPRAPARDPRRRDIKYKPPKSKKAKRKAK